MLAGPIRADRKRTAEVRANIRVLVHAARRGRLRGKRATEACARLYVLCGSADNIASEFKRWHDEIQYTQPKRAYVLFRGFLTMLMHCHGVSLPQTAVPRPRRRKHPAEQPPPLDPGATR